MRTLLFMIGVFLILLSIPGYMYTPMMVANMVHYAMSFMGGGSQASGMSLLKQMGYPSRTVVISMMQYTFMGLEIAGAGLLLVGAIGKKKIPKQPVQKVVAESKVITEPQIVTEPKKESPPVSADKQVNLRSLRILEERLAKGEITPNQFQSLKKLLE